MGWKYPDEVVRFISDNVVGRTTKELVELTNTKLGTSFTESSMKAFKNNYKLKSGTRCGMAAGSPTKKYPAEIKAFIHKHCAGIGPREMSELLNKTFDKEYTVSQLKGYYANHDIDSGLTGYYQKGHVPVNKGKKGYHAAGCEKGWFKKGDTPLNHKPVGSERVDIDGYTLIKVNEPNVWKPKHRILWEEHNGLIPKGHKLIFGDGNKGNISLDNLILVTDSQMAVLNHFDLIQKDVELTKTALVVADIKIKISQKKHSGQN